ncbi:hypothetical protein [Flavobacterium rhizosphaerae]|uniref:Carboxypeptidase regulatory-like domain-containing protein n=1 Tax=Flavobacterium rhizosphaerae TaxID=3163298 RepID=A0ABW8Z0D0_9FLAO
MEKIKKIFFFVLLSASAGFGQVRDTLNGRVVSNNQPMFDVYVINKTTGAEVKTNHQGNFKLPAKPGDALVVYSDKTQVREFAVWKESIQQNPYIIAVEYKGFELEEVVINDTLNAESLGLVPDGQKKYTPAEKKVYTATDLNVVKILGIIPVGMSLDPLLNAISGRTKALKKTLATEKKEYVIDKIYSLFSEKELKSFNVPEEYVKGFIFYIVEDEGFTNAIKAENTELVKFRIQILSEEYTELLRKNE